MKKYKTVKELLSDKSRWCKNKLFTTKTGKETTKQNAERCCLLGAIFLVYGNDKRASRVRVKVKRVLEKINSDNNEFQFYGLAAFNDSKATTHKVLMEVLNKANI